MFPYAMHHRLARMETSYVSLCNASSQRNDLIKLTHFNETKKRAQDSRIVRAKDTLKLSHGGPSQRHVSSTNQWI